MTALQQIFQGYYEHRIESDEPVQKEWQLHIKRFLIH